MKNFFADNWFKLIASIGILAVGVAAIYYYVIYLPATAQSSRIAAESFQNETSQTTPFVTPSTSTTPTTTASANTSTGNLVATTGNKKGSSQVGQTPPTTQENVKSTSSSGQAQIAAPSAQTATTTPIAVSQQNQVGSSGASSSPYFNVFKMGATSDRSSSTFDRIAEIYFSAGDRNAGYSLGPLTLTFIGNALIPNSLSGVNLFDAQGNAVPVRTVSTCGSTCIITFDLSNYTVGIGEAGSFILTMDDRDLNLEPTTPPGGQRNLSASIASENDVFQTANGIDPFMYTAFPVVVTSFAYDPDSW